MWNLGTWSRLYLFLYTPTHFANSRFTQMPPNQIQVRVCDSFLFSNSKTLTIKPAPKASDTFASCSIPLGDHPRLETPFSSGLSSAPLLCRQPLPTRALIPHEATPGPGLPPQAGADSAGHPTPTSLGVSDAKVGARHLQWARPPGHRCTGGRTSRESVEVRPRSQRRRGDSRRARDKGPTAALKPEGALRSTHLGADPTEAALLICR